MLALAALLALGARADLDVYVDGALASGWENWSWSTDIDFAATDLYEGLSSISLNSQAWAAFSLKLEGVFGTYAGLQFDVAGAPPDAQIYIESTGAGVQSPTIPFSVLGNFTANEFKTVLLDFSQLPPAGTPLGNNTWDRLNFQAGGNGAAVSAATATATRAQAAQYHLDNIKLVSSIVIEPEFLSAEPLANNIIAVTTQGAVDFSTVKVTLNNAVRVWPVLRRETHCAADRGSLQQGDVLARRCAVQEHHLPYPREEPRAGILDNCRRRLDVRVHAPGSSVRNVRTLLSIVRRVAQVLI